MSKESVVSARSPFSDNRFEHEIRHLYVVKLLSFYHRLEELKPTVLVGARGTGKTTLLRSLSWRERISNPSLRQQLGSRRANNFIGIYIKIPEVHVVGLIEWLQSGSQATKQTIYSRYLELLVLQEILGAVSELRANAEIEIDALQERGLISQLVQEHRGAIYIDDDVNPLPRTIDELRDEIRKVRKVIERSVQRGLEPSRAWELIGEPTGLFELAQQICEGITRVGKWRGNSLPINFKVCFDEAEALEAIGVAILMTWIRVARQPLSFVTSFVSLPSDWSQTLLPNLTIQKADANTVSLDDLKDDEFTKFAEGVADLRVREFLRRESNDVIGSVDDSPLFSVESLFGKLNLNSLLEWMLRDSESPIAREVIERAQAIFDQSQAIAQRSGKGDDSVRPIYQAYLEYKDEQTKGYSRRRIVKPPVSGSPEAFLRWTKRRIESQNDRKRMVAAYLSLAKEINADVKYAYADMVLQLSDSCIRDFLSNVDAIFTATRCSTVEFLKLRPVLPTLQHQGLKAASLAKRKSLPTLGVNRPSDIAKLVEGLGKLTRELQSGQVGGLRHISSSERGVFKVPIQAVPTATETSARDLVIDAAEAGFLKIEHQEPFSISFRIHTSLAAYFGLSYRGAYYKTPLSAADIMRFCEAADTSAIDTAVRSLLRSIDGAATHDLFATDVASKE